MKKNMIIVGAALLLLSSCGTYTGSGAYVGASFGSILGSAIGGISDGRHGSDVGTLIGMAGGAVVGSAIGAAADRKAEQEVHDHYQAVMQRKAAEGSATSYGYEQQELSASGFDSSNSADDRLYDFGGTEYTGNYSAQQPQTVMPHTSSVDDLVSGMAYAPSIEIKNARFVDDNRDNNITRGETCKVIFEVYNRGSHTLYDLQPTVVETTGNRHLYISPGMHVEQLAPGSGIRYTAIVKADNRLRDGEAKICLSVVQGSDAISKVVEFNIPTRKR